VLAPILESDKHALIWINSHHSLPLDAILAPVAYAGEGGALWFALALGLLVFGKRPHRVTGLVLALTIILVDRLICAPLGHAFFRTRPYLDVDGIRQLGVRWSGTSFPSGHAHSVWIAAITLGSQWRKLAIPLLVFGLLTCYSRPYCGMHYPLDVMAGSVVGISAGFLVAAGRRTWNRHHASKAQTQARGQ